MTPQERAAMEQSSDLIERLARLPNISAIDLQRAGEAQMTLRAALEAPEPRAMKTNLEIASKCGAVIERTSEHWKPPTFSVCFNSAQLDAYTAAVIASHEAQRRVRAKIEADHLVRLGDASLSVVVYLVSPREVGDGEAGRLYYDLRNAVLDAQSNRGTCSPLVRLSDAHAAIAAKDAELAAMAAEVARLKTAVMEQESYSAQRGEATAAMPQEIKP